MKDDEKNTETVQPSLMFVVTNYQRPYAKNTNAKSEKTKFMGTAYLSLQFSPKPEDKLMSLRVDVRQRVEDGTFTIGNYFPRKDGSFQHNINFKNATVEKNIVEIIQQFCESQKILFGVPEHEAGGDPKMGARFAYAIGSAEPKADIVKDDSNTI